MLSNYFAHACLNVMRGTSFTGITTMYGALFSVLPLPDGTGGTELSGSGYTRIACTMGAPSSRKITSTADVLFPAVTGSPLANVIAFGFFDASTSGNYLGGEYLSAAEALPFTAAVSGNLITAPAHGMIATDRVVLDNSEVGVLPGGLSATTVYFVITPATDTFSVSLTSGGAAVTISSSGAGLFRKVDIKTLGVGEQYKIAAGNLTQAIR
jgi:hypothetical protein